MSRSVQKSPKDQAGHKLSHYGLIKVLVSEEMKNKGSAWEAFVEAYHSGGGMKVFSLKGQQGKKNKKNAEPKCTQRQKGKLQQEGKHDKDSKITRPQQTKKQGKKVQKEKKIVKVEVLVLEPTRRLTRGMLKSYYTSSSKKTSKPATPSEVEVIEDSESSRKGCVCPEEPSLDI